GDGRKQVGDDENRHRNRKSPSGLANIAVPAAQVKAVYVLENQKVCAILFCKFEYLDNTWMVELCEDPRFTIEHPIDICVANEIGQDSLDDYWPDGPSGFFRTGEINDSHTPAGESVEDPVPAQHESPDQIIGSSRAHLEHTSTALLTSQHLRYDARSNESRASDEKGGWQSRLRRQ